MKLRLFVAIPLSTEIRTNLTAMQAALTGSEPVRWSAPDSFHLTVAFLGDREDTLLPEICDVCATIASKTTAFRFRVYGASSFPRHGPVKTIWVGLTEGGTEWKSLVKLSEPLLIPYGMTPHSGLVPHITLGRARGDDSTEALRNAIEQYCTSDAGEQVADEIQLIRSTLDPGGARHDVIQAWPLTGPPDTSLRSS